MVDGADAPQARRTRRIDEVEPGERAILDDEAQGRLRIEPQCKRQGGADGAAVRDGNDVAAAMLGGEPVNRRTHALHEVDEALSARCTLVRGREPERMCADLALGIEGLALETLPDDAESLNASLELYPDDPATAPDVTVRMALLPAGNDTPILEGDIVPQLAGATRIASTQLPVADLAAGSYLVRATIVEGGVAVGTVSMSLR